MQRHYAGLAKLGLLYGQDAAVQICIRVGQVERFRDPKPGRCDQTEQRRIGGGTKTVRRADSTGCDDQRSEPILPGTA